MATKGASVVLNFHICWQLTCFEIITFLQIFLIHSSNLTNPLLFVLKSYLECSYNVTTVLLYCELHIFCCTVVVHPNVSGATSTQVTPRVVNIPKPPNSSVSRLKHVFFAAKTMKYPIKDASISHQQIKKNTATGSIFLLSTQNKCSKLFQEIQLQLAECRPPEGLLRHGRCQLISLFDGFVRQTTSVDIHPVTKIFGCCIHLHFPCVVDMYDIVWYSGRTLKISKVLRFPRLLPLCLVHSGSKQNTFASREAAIGHIAPVSSLDGTSWDWFIDAKSEKFYGKKSHVPQYLYYTKVHVVTYILRCMYVSYGCFRK